MESEQDVKENCVTSLAETHSAQLEQAKDWAELQGLTQPMLLDNSIREEVEKATKVLDNSSALAVKILDLLNDRDNLYAKTLRVGGSRTDKMLQLLRHQAEELSQKCQEELESSEELFLQVYVDQNSKSFNLLACLMRL